MAYELILAALADPTRRALLKRLRRSPQAVQELAEGLPVSRPAVSQHLQVLRAAGLAHSRRAGTRRIYRLDTRGFAELRAWIDRFLDDDEAVEAAPPPSAPDPALAPADPRAAQPAASVTNHLTAAKAEPLRKSVTVRRPPPAAFRLFTQGIASWWPLASHSLTGADAASCAIEGRPGGRVFERSRLGRPLIWGHVLAWEPPRRLVFSWHPGREAETAQEIEVSFRDAGDGATLVELEHRGWERLGAEAAEAREDYDSGWDHVLAECYARAAQSAP